MDLYIDCPLGPTLRLSASPCDTVLSVKLRLQALLCNSLPANQQRLVWRTCELVNERQLSDYSLESGCTIKLLPRLFAGPTNMQQLPSASALQQQQQQLLALQAYRLTVDARDSVNPRSVDRCQACGRRTGPSSSFECRCGRIYCARHRYPESHSCSFDFKEQGRQLLRESNPRVLAPKLQRI
uniref:AN1-type domain-containing protein n=1 Tax=Macrostomum lignano TaxID=282301 RepID=A0A1I8J3T9_9PLAT